MHPIRNIMGIDQHTFHLDFGWGYDCHWLPIMIIFAVQIVLCSSAIYDVITYYKSLPLICCLPNAFIIINCILVMPGLSVLEPVQWCPRQGSTDSPDMGNDASTLMKQADLAIENWLFALNRWVLICFNISGCFMRIEPSTNREFYRNLYIESWGQNIKYGDFTFQKNGTYFDQTRITQMILLGWEPIFGKFIGMSRMILYGSAVMVWNPLLYIYDCVVQVPQTTRTSRWSATPRESLAMFGMVFVMEWSIMG